MLYSVCLEIYCRGNNAEKCVAPFDGDMWTSWETWCDIFDFLKIITVQKT